MQINLFQLSIVSGSVYLNFFFLYKNQSLFSISECICNINGSTSLDCHEDNGKCSCKDGYTGIKCDGCMPNVVGDKCETCQPRFFDFPSCQEGLPKLIMHIFEKSKVLFCFRM